MACGLETMRVLADRWPDAVEVSAVAGYATAFAAGAVNLADSGPR